MPKQAREEGRGSRFDRQPKPSVVGAHIPSVGNVYLYFLLVEHNYAYYACFQVDRGNFNPNLFSV